MFFWSRKETRVYIENGGFDVRGCPEPEKVVQTIVVSVNCHDRLVDALDKLLALYRKETNLHYGLDNPITKECRDILVEARRA